MENEKKLSLIKSTVIQYLIDGFAWLGYGITFLFDNLPSKIIAIILMAIAVICSLMIIFCKKESPDEMSKAHILKAKAAVCNVIYAVALIFACIIPTIMIFNINILIPIKFLFPLLLGTIQIIIGFMFVYYEKVGD